MRLRRIALPIVSYKDRPLEGGIIPELGQFHFANQRSLFVFPGQRMRAGVVSLPITRVDLRRVDFDPFPTASLAALEREGQIGDVASRVGRALFQHKQFPLFDEHHLGGGRLR
jgi:hypothetical protein